MQIKATAKVRQSTFLHRSEAMTRKRPDVDEQYRGTSIEPVTDRSASPGWSRHPAPRPGGVLALAVLTHAAGPTSSAGRIRCTAFLGIEVTARGHRTP